MSHTVGPGSQRLGRDPDPLSSLKLLLKSASTQPRAILARWISLSTSTPSTSRAGCSPDRADHRSRSRGADVSGMEAPRPSRPHRRRPPVGGDLRGHGQDRHAERRRREAFFDENRPADADLVDWFRLGHAALCEALRRRPRISSAGHSCLLPPRSHSGPRRQAHETTIHRVDAEVDIWRPSRARTPGSPPTASTNCCRVSPRGDASSLQTPRTDGRRDDRHGRPVARHPRNREVTASAVSAAAPGAD